MSEAEGRNRKIEAMYREKNDRIAKQVALKAAVDVVSIAEPCRLDHPEQLMRRVLVVADEFYRWLKEVEGGR
jgi:hypothetical protein